MATKEQKEALKRLVPDDTDREMYVNWLSRCVANDELAYVMRDLYIKGYVHFKEDAVSKEKLNILIAFTPNDKQWKLPSVRHHIHKFLNNKEVQAMHKDAERQRYRTNTNEEEVGSFYVVIKVKKSGSTEEMAAKAADCIRKGNYGIVKVCDPLTPITGIEAPAKYATSPRRTYNGVSSSTKCCTLAGLKKARQGATGLVYINFKDLPAHVRPTTESLLKTKMPFVIRGKVKSLRTGMLVKVRI